MSVNIENSTRTISLKMDVNGEWVASSPLDFLYMTMTNVMQDAFGWSYWAEDFVEGSTVSVRTSEQSVNDLLGHIAIKTRLLSGFVEWYVGSEQDKRHCGAIMLATAMKELIPFELIRSCPNFTKVQSYFA